MMGSHIEVSVTGVMSKIQNGMEAIVAGIFWLHRLWGRISLSENMQMPLPVPVPRLTAPTDNLYRFLSLFGLALVVLAVVLMSVRVYQHNALVHDARVDAAVSAERTFQMAEDLHNHIQRTTPGEASEPSSTLAADSTSAPSATKGATPSNGIATIEQNLHELQERKLATARLQAELDADKSTMDANMRDLTLLLRAGFVISPIGFVLWYFLLQRPQDQLLAARVAIRLRQLKEHSSKK